MKESTKRTLAVMNTEHRYIDANCKTLKEFRIAINQLVDDDNMPEVLALINKDRERAVGEAKLALLVDLEAKTDDGEWLSVWIKNQYAQLPNPTQEKGKL
jgi:hypothetical protein